MISTLIKTKTNCGWFSTDVSLRFQMIFCWKGVMWRKTYYHCHRVDLDLQTQSGCWGCPSPAPLRCKEADGFDPWSHFLTRLRCQITFWPRKHLQFAWATSDLAMIDRSSFFIFFFFWSITTNQFDKMTQKQPNQSFNTLNLLGENGQIKYSIVFCLAHYYAR